MLRTLIKRRPESEQENHEWGLKNVISHLALAFARAYIQERYLQVFDCVVEWSKGSPGGGFESSDRWKLRQIIQRLLLNNVAWSFFEVQVSQDYLILFETVKSSFLIMNYLSLLLINKLLSN